jgi:hypothetical protein
MTDVMTPLATIESGPLTEAEPAMRKEFAGHAERLTEGSAATP